MVGQTELWLRQVADYLQSSQSTVLYTNSQESRAILQRRFPDVEVKVIRLQRTLRTPTGFQVWTDAEESRR